MDKIGATLTTGEHQVTNPTVLERAFKIQRAGDRAFYDHGWLRTSHSFSFADYYDSQNVNWGALRVFNDDRVAAGQGFGTHPHRDMEILTYVLAGQLEHRDSLGSHGVVRAGGVQYMSAGTGVRHSEFNHSQTEELHFLQMWVLPGRLGEKPRYGQVDFDDEERRGKWLVVASGRPSVEGRILLTQDASCMVSRLEGRSLRHTFEPGRLGFLFVADGEVVAEAFGDDDAPIGKATLAAGDAVRMSAAIRLSVRGVGELVLWDLPVNSDPRG
jgi:redox-sensitive bicupin YhaK (pirin superfamily)